MTTRARHVCLSNMTELSLDGRARPRAEVLSDPASSFDAIFHAHYQRLVRLAGLLGADDPEDVAQEAFARFYRRRKRLRDGNAAFPYLRSTVYNLTRNRLRHLRIARRRAPIRPTDVTPAEQIAITHEDHRELLEALDRLPRKQREALILRYWLDLSEQEIAQTMGIAPGTVKSHAHRGINALKTTLGEQA
jgi:RNA polymerase sigma-70 factor (sigma-E family)